MPSLFHISSAKISWMHCIVPVFNVNCNTITYGNWLENADPKLLKGCWPRITGTNRIHIFCDMCFICTKVHSVFVLHLTLQNRPCTDWTLYKKLYFTVQLQIRRHNLESLCQRFMWWHLLLSYSLNISRLKSAFKYLKNALNSQYKVKI